MAPSEKAVLHNRCHGAHRKPSNVNNITLSRKVACLWPDITIDNRNRLKSKLLIARSQPETKKYKQGAKNHPGDASVIDREMHCKKPSRNIGLSNKDLRRSMSNFCQPKCLHKNQSGVNIIIHVYSMHTFKRQSSAPRTLKS